MNNAKKGEFGEQFVAKYLKTHGFHQIKKAVGINGCDLLATKNRHVYKIEVKTSNNQFGIPDMHHTEFICVKNGYYFVADFLYIVRLDGNKINRLDILTKKEVNKHAKNHKLILRIRPTKLKTDLKNKIVGQMISILSVSK